jgi:hypothetical protein
VYFHYCAYWRRWSLVIFADGNYRIELDLEPGRHDQHRIEAWAEVHEGRFRVHATPSQPDKGDIDTSERPADLVRRMSHWLDAKRVGELTTGKVLDELASPHDEAIRMIRQASMIRFGPLCLGEVRILNIGVA